MRVCGRRKPDSTSDATGSDSVISYSDTNSRNVIYPFKPHLHGRRGRHPSGNHHLIRQWYDRNARGDNAARVTYACRDAHACTQGMAHGTGHPRIGQPTYDRDICAGSVFGE